ncbi:MAG TPA: FtsX-like permease family protein, partial [Dehalococcoidia bacterium]|nr:FtsX-like permease family protein [Dehalococcoidia bacterium]
MPRTGSAFFPRLVWRSLQRRWRKGLAALLAMGTAATLAAATLALALGIEERASDTLGAYGANIVLADRVQSTGGYIPEEKLDRLAPVAPQLAAVVPYLYGVAEAGGRPVVIAGTRFSSLLSLSPWWEVQGAWVDDSDAGGALVGANAARKLRISLGDTLTLRHDTRDLGLRVQGLVVTGSDEENQVFVTLAAAQRLLNREGYLSLVQVRARSSEGVEATAREIEGLLPGLEAATLRQVAEAERHLVRRVVLLLALVTAGVVVAGTLSVAATTMTAALQRRGEAGLMKALGSPDTEIWRLFLVEAVALGLVAGLLGGLVGFGLAEAVGRTVFAAGLPWRWEPLLGALALATGISVAATLLPART